MSSKAAHDLASPDGQDDYGNDLLALMRDGHFSAASDLLADDIAALSPELWDICAAASAGSLSVQGWSRLSDALVDPVWAQITAVGIEISGHGTTPMGEPCVEVCFYSDDSFPFSTAGRAAILAENEGYGTPWQGAFDEIDVVDVTISGLSELHCLIVEEQARQERPEPGSDAAIALYLAVWWRTVQFHQLIHDTHRRDGLSRSVPLIVGSHDCGPFVETVIAPDEVLAAQAIMPADEPDPITIEAAFEPVEERETDSHDEGDEPAAADVPLVRDSWSLPDPVAPSSDDVPPAPDDDMPAPTHAIDEEAGEFSASALRRKLASDPGAQPVEYKPSLLGRLFARR